MKLEHYSLDHIREDMIRFKNDLDFQKLENFYYSKSFSEILGISRKEICHSNFLVWLLHGSESHGLANFCIKKLLDIIVKYSRDNEKTNHKEIFNAFITENYVIEKVEIIPEYVVKNVGRIDIYIEVSMIINNEFKNIVLIIENKVETKENNDQTNKYYNYFSELVSENKTFLFIYVTPISASALMDLIEPECNCKQFIQINYQSIVDYMIEPALNQNISQKTHHILTEYLKSLSQPTISVSADGYKQSLIMALGNEERKLLTNFWDKNQKLILAALYAISSDPAQEKDTRDSIDAALENLSTDKDRSIYNIKYNGETFAEKFRKSDIGLQTIKLLQHYNLIDSNVIEYLQQDRSCSFPLIKTSEYFTDTEIKYRKYKTTSEPELIYNAQNYYVARNWGINNIDKFIAKFTEKFSGLQYEVNV